MWHPKNIFYFLFLRIKDMKFLDNIFKLLYTIFTCFLKIIYKKNNYTCRIIKNKIINIKIIFKILKNKLKIF